VAVFPIGRREFLAALASLGLIPSRGLSSTRYPVHLRKANPYDGVLAQVEPGTDEFKFEKEALEIEGKLSAMLRGTELPLASEFTGASPLPLRYRTIAPGVSEAEFPPEGGFQDVEERLNKPYNRKWNSELKALLNTKRITPEVYEQFYQVTGLENK